MRSAWGGGGRGPMRVPDRKPIEKLNFIRCREDEPALIDAWLQTQ
jgi:hypothetical protein